MTRWNFQFNKQYSMCSMAPLWHMKKKNNNPCNFLISCAAGQVQLWTIQFSFSENCSILSKRMSKYCQVFNKRMKICVNSPFVDQLKTKSYKDWKGNLFVVFHFVAKLSYSTPTTQSSALDSIEGCIVVDYMKYLSSVFHRLELRRRTRFSIAIFANCREL